jgi:hypothetical protein
MRHDMVLAAVGMNSLKHSGENIADRVGDALKNNGFSLDKLLCCVRDDAKNMQSAANNLETNRLMDFISYILQKYIYSFQCVAHFLHLVIGDALKEEGIVSDVIARAHEWTKECRKSSGRAILKRHQEQHEIKKNELIMVFYLISNII